MNMRTGQLYGSPLGIERVALQKNIRPCKAAIPTGGPYNCEISLAMFPAGSYNRSIYVTLSHRELLTQSLNNLFKVHMQLI